MSGKWTWLYSPNLSVELRAVIKINIPLPPLYRTVLAFSGVFSFPQWQFPSAPAQVSIYKCLFPPQLSVPQGVSLPHVWNDRKWHCNLFVYNGRIIQGRQQIDCSPCLCSYRILTWLTLGVSRVTRCPRFALHFTAFWPFVLHPAYWDICSTFWPFGLHTKIMFCILTLRPASRILK